MSKSAASSVNFAFACLGGVIGHWDELSAEERFERVEQARKDLDNAFLTLALGVERRYLGVGAIYARYEGDGTHTVLVADYKAGCAWSVEFSHECEGVDGERLVDVLRATRDGGYDSLRALPEVSKVLGLFLSDV